MEIIIGRSSNYVGTFLKYLINSPRNYPVRCLYHSNFIQNKWNTPSKFERRNDILMKNTFPIANWCSISKNRLFSSDNGLLFRNYSSNNEKTSDNVPKKVNIFQKMKQLTKDYWHILIPVHLATSIVWVFIFWTAAKNGVDVISLMEYIHTPEKYIEMLKNSGAGNWAVTYALYKIFTPIRYTVTVGGTTMSIRYLDRMGYLKFKRRSTETTQSNKCDVKSKEKSEN